MRLLIFLLACGSLTGSDIYYTAAASGGNTGTDCSNAYALSDAVHGINHAAQWIAGNNLHLCGAFTGTGGAGLIASQAAGANGNPVTVVFEVGASLKAPYWGTNDGTNPTSGAITINHNYVVVDLGTNGLIQNTLNGTSGAACPGGTCTSQNITSAIVVTAVTGAEIKSTSAGGTIADMYDKTPCSSDQGKNSYGVFVYQNSGGTVSGLSVHDLTMHDMIGGFSGGYSAWSNISVYNNVMSRMSIEIGAGDRGNDSTLSGFLIYNNQIFDNYVWWDTGDINHLNAMHPFAVHSGSSITGLNIYNNYIHGDFGAQNCGATGHQTSDIFVEAGGGTSGNIFNNVFIANGTGDYPANGYVVAGAPFGIYNNTIIGNVHGAYGISNGSGIVTVNNNLVSTVDAFEQQFSTSTLVSDYNLLFSGTSSPFLYGAGASTRISFATWLSDGFDAHGQTGNPNIVGTWPVSGIAAIPAYTFASSAPLSGSGTNLFSVCNGQSNPGLGALCSDAVGNVRPSVAAWDIGAYQYQAPASAGAVCSGQCSFSGAVVH